jgi:cysteine desulfurase / selenocysteine lyase
MTTDDRSFDPTQGLAGPLSQTLDLGGRGVSGLPPTSVPDAFGTASPSLAVAGSAPSLPSTGPVSGPDDPRVLALAIERIAGEFLSNVTGNSFMPAETFVPTVSMPAPLAPMAREANRLVYGAGDTNGLAIAIARLASEFFGGPARAPDASTTHAPAGQPTLRPPTVNDVVLPGPWRITPALAHAALGAPVAAANAPMSTSSFASIGSLAMLDAIQLPFMDATPIDAAPYFLPASGVVGLETDGSRPRNLPYEVDVQSPGVRNLGGAAFDPYTIRRDFPILEERIHGGKRLVWLDNAATTQKPRQVIERLTYFYEHENSNIRRIAHVLAARAADAYESSRETVRRFIHAGSSEEIVFVRGSTEGINLVAQSWGRRNVTAGDEIVLTNLEHHANIVPWQMLCAATGARLRIAPVDDRGDVILEEYERLLNPRTRLVAFPQVSNSLGTVTPAREMIDIAHRYGALVLLDGAQAVSHMRVNVQALDCDFYVFSGHKVFAPTGIGALYAKRAILDGMPPWQGGGNMIQDVTFERTTYQPPPVRFEAGTGSIADAVALGAALDYVTDLGIDNIERYEHDLLAYAERRLVTVPGLKIIGTPRNKAGVVSFVLDGQRTEDVGGALDKEGIAVRSGHHCAQPILRRFGVEVAVRASFAMYNIAEDIDILIDALCRLQA